MRSLLTSPVPFGNSDLPQIIRGVTSAFSFPQGLGKVLSAYSAVEEAIVFGGLLSHIRQGATSSNREVWRLRMSRGALPLPSFLSPNHTRFPMHYFPLSRPARCGGVSSLESVLRKLARAGEASALAGLLRLPLSLATRVRWAAFGTLLSLEVL